MKKEDVKNMVQQIVNEKLQLLFNRLDQFQNHFLLQIDDLKQMDAMMQVDLPNDFVTEESAPAGDNESIQVIHEHVKKISSATNQLILINCILEGINHFCKRSALFLLREDKLVGWKGRGFSGADGEISDEELKKVFFSLSANTILKHVLQTKVAYLGEPHSRPDDFLVFNRLGGGKPKKILVLPFFVKGKPQAVIYADVFDEETIHQNAIEIIASVGELSLDLLPLRQKILARVKTQEFIDAPEPAETPPSHVNFDQMDEQEKTAPPLRDNDPERLARVIINDIILYNQRVVDDGLRNHNLYEVLKETLMQAREMYLRKFNDLRCFEEQMIKILAKGNKSALKGYQFEALK
jgi:hypothetical protein